MALVASLPRLDAKVWFQKVSAFVALKQTKKDTARAAEAADSAYRAARGELLREILPGNRAVCGDFVLTVREGSTAAASVTLPDGRKVAWSDVTSITIGNETVKAARCLLYGGRSATIDIDVS